MPSAPKNPYPERSKPAKKWLIRLGPDTGLDPTAADVTKRLKKPVCHFMSGGNLDYAEMQYDLGGEGQRILDTYLEAGFTRQVEILQQSDTKGGRDILMFWGEIIGEAKQLSPNGESIIVKASIMKYHFGDQLIGPVYRRPTGGHDPVVHQTDIIFNPVVNNIVEGNLSKYRNTSTEKYSHWVHPDSVRTATARASAQDDDEAFEWDLPNVINTLCWYLNPFETYIKNPTLTDLETWMEDAPKVRDVTLQRGKYLNEYLDDLLSAHGFAWKLDYKYDDDNDRRVSLVIYEKNKGKEVDLTHQRPFDTSGARFDQSNTPQIDIETEIASTANQVKCIGGLKEFEITAELYRGWSESDDSLGLDTLTQSTSTDARAHGAPWRLWVLNEAGDYCGLRTTVAPIPSTPFDLRDVLGTDSIPKRRKAEDCLTHFRDDADDGSRRRRPVFVQWYNDEDEWKPLPDGWGETVLDDQIGIYFAGDAPPDELMGRGNNARIRITFTVTSDLAITATSNKSDDSPNGRVNQLTLDVSDRFVYREVLRVGPLLSVLAGVPSADEKDDTDALAEFAGTIRTTEDCAIMRGTATVFGINNLYQIGQIVRRVKGREISFNRMAKTSKTQRYLQIVSKTVNLEDQTTMLTMEPVEESINKKFAGWVA